MKWCGRLVQQQSWVAHCALAQYSENDRLRKRKGKDRENKIVQAIENNSWRKMSMCPMWNRRSRDRGTFYRRLPKIWKKGIRYENSSNFAWKIPDVPSLTKEELIRFQLGETVNAVKPSITDILPTCLWSNKESCLSQLRLYFHSFKIISLFLTLHTKIIPGNMVTFWGKKHDQTVSK